MRWPIYIHRTTYFMPSVHSVLIRVTPAMEAGMTKSALTLENVVANLVEAPSNCDDQGPYKKKI